MVSSGSSRPGTEDMPQTAGIRDQFELRVMQQGETCLLLLLWDQRRQHLSASLPMSPQLTQRYELWRKRYGRFYEFQAAAPIGNSGRLNPGSGDPAHDLMVAEQALVQAFRRWLGEGEGRLIQQAIRDRLMALLQQDAAVGISMLITCQSKALSRLPWEQWDLAPATASADAVQIFRGGSGLGTLPLGDRPKPKRPHRKPRILAILADDPSLGLPVDGQILRTLSPVADVQRLTWPAHLSPAQVKVKISETLRDDRGWDVLYFGGHSDETTTSGGQSALSPTVQLSTHDLQDCLEAASRCCLQLAIFNSCSGLDIADG